MAAVGQAACVPVGPIACAEGFRAGPRGWGCEAIRPTEPCAGAARARIGDTSCAPVSDCDAAFPPAGADATVHGAAELVAALGRVPAGGTIALDAGTYNAIEIKKNIHLVGRCVSKVMFEGTGGVQGILVRTPKVTVSVRGITITGFNGGVVAANGATIDLADVAILASPYGIVGTAATVRGDGVVLEGPPATGPHAGQGLLAVTSDKGAEVTLANADIREYAGAIRSTDRGRATLRRSLVSSYSNLPESKHLFGSYSDGHVTIEESGVYIRQSKGTFAIVGRTFETVVQDKNPRPGRLRFVSSELSKADFDDAGWIFGVHEGARVELENTTVVHRADAAFDVRDAETTLSLKDSAILSTTQEGVAHTAVTVFSGAAAELEGVAIVSPSSSAIFVADLGSRVSFARSLVTGMHSGAGTSSLVADRACSISVDGSAIMDSDGYALIGNAASKITISTSIFDGSGVGLGVAITATSSLAMNGSIVRKHGDAALTFVLGARGTVSDSLFYDNKVAVHLDGSRILEAAEGVVPVLGEGEVVFQRNTFTNNAEYLSTTPTTLLVRGEP